MSFKPKNKKLVIIAGVLIVLGIIFLVLLRGDEDIWTKDSAGNWVMHGNPAIQSFEDCARKYPVMETYPEQCRVPNGPSFTKHY